MASVIRAPREILRFVYEMASLCQESLFYVQTFRSHLGVRTPSVRMRIRVRSVRRIVMRDIARYGLLRVLVTCQTVDFDIRRIVSRSRRIWPSSHVIILWIQIVSVRCSIVVLITTCFFASSTGMI